MYVKTEADNLQAIKIEGMSDVAEFSDNNIAQVNQEDGTVLIDKYPEKFSEHSSQQ